MKKILLAMVVVVVLTLSTAAAAFANPLAPACNGLDVAHDRIHSSGTQGELTLHDLRAKNHCGH